MHSARRILTLIATIAAAGCSGDGHADATVPRTLPSVGGGTPTELLPRSGDAAVVWVFVATDCPIANAYAPEIEAIATDYRDAGARLIVVHTDPGVEEDEVARHTEEYGYTCPVVVDRDRALVRHAGATMTPEACVFDSGGVLRYRGRIDDRFPDLAARRPAATTRELRDAIEAVIAGREVATARAPAVGCVIEEAGPR